MEYEFGPHQWYFLFFRALLMNPVYEVYSIERACRKDPEHKGTPGLLTEIKTQYPEISKLFEFWTCVSFYRDPKKTDQTCGEKFEIWLTLNKEKLMPFLFDSFIPINAGDPIDPVMGEVYFTIPENIDILQFQERHLPIFVELYKKANKLAYESLPLDLKDAKEESEYRLAPTERRLDAYDWVFVEELNPTERVVKAATSGKKCWRDVFHEVKDIVGDDHMKTLNAENTLLKTTDLDETKNEIRKAANEGTQLIEQNLLRGKFPSVKNYA